MGLLRPRRVRAVPPPPAAAAGRPSIRKGTRVADKLLIIDLPRMPPLLHVAQLMFSLPLAMVFPVNNGHISALRAYSPAITLELRRSSFNVRGRWQIAVAPRRPRRTYRGHTSGIPRHETGRVEPRWLDEPAEHAHECRLLESSPAFAHGAAEAQQTIVASAASRLD
jgi:hypothetical protein